MKKEFNSEDIVQIKLGFYNRRYLIPNNLFLELIDRKKSHFAICDEKKESVIVLSYDPKKIAFHIKPYSKNEEEIIILLGSTYKEKLNSSNDIGIIRIIKNYCRFYSLNEINFYYNQKFSETKSNPKIAKYFLGTDNRSSFENPSDYDLKANSEDLSESEWLEWGISDEESEEYNEDKDINLL